MTNHCNLKRFITFDFIRGIAIIGVIILHRMLWDFFAPTRLASGNLEVSAGEGLLVFFFSMAGIFYVISGAMNAYVTYNRLSSGRNKPKQIVFGGWITGLSLIFFHYIFRLLFVRATDADTAIITYFILSGKYQGVSPTTIFNVGTLQMIGITIIFVSTVLGLVFMNEGFKQIKRAYSVFAIIGVIILILTPYMQTLLYPSLVEALSTKNWSYFFFVSPIVYGLFPIFPFLSFGCFGAVLGITLGREENPRRIKLALLLVSLIFWIVAIPNFKEIAVMADYRDWETLINQLARQVIQLGLFFFWIWLGVTILDFRPEEKRRQLARLTEWVNEMGKMTLTIFMFEGFLSVILIRLIRPLWPTYNVTLGNITIFGLINLSVWILILKLWKKVDYKGSTEWCLVYIVKILSGKQSSRLRPKTEVATSEA